MRTVDAVSAQPRCFLGKVWGRSKTFLIVSTLLGLSSLNVLTLLNDAVHAAGYSAIRAILASALPDAALSKMLMDSPTAKRKREIATATKLFARENAKLAASNKAIEQARMDAELAKKKIAAEHVELKRASEQQALTAKKISRRLATRSVANASRHVSSVAGQAIPFAGTAIIVGVTALDIRDACETMKDVNALNSAFGHEGEDQTKVCGMNVPNKQKVLAQIKANWKIAYQSAADSVNKAGAALVPSTPTQLSWFDVRATVCPVVGTLPGGCP